MDIYGYISDAASTECTGIGRFRKRFFALLTVRPLRSRIGLGETYTRERLLPQSAFSNTGLGIADDICFLIPDARECSPWGERQRVVQGVRGMKGEEPGHTERERELHEQRPDRRMCAPLRPLNCAFIPGNPVEVGVSMQIVSISTVSEVQMVSSAANKREKSIALWDSVTHVVFTLPRPRASTPKETKKKKKNKKQQRTSITKRKSNNSFVCFAGLHIRFLLPSSMAR